MAEPGPPTSTQWPIPGRWSPRLQHTIPDNRSRLVLKITQYLADPSVPLNIKLTVKAAIRIVAYIARALRAGVCIAKDILIAAYINKAIEFAAYIAKATWTDVYIAKAMKIALLVIAKDILSVVFIIIIALSPALTTRRPPSLSLYSPRPTSRTRGW